MRLSTVVIALLVVAALVIWSPYTRISTGNSMEPHIAGGTDLVICSPVNVTNSVEEGDIVIWAHDGPSAERTKVLHRVVAMDAQNRTLRTKGDNTSRPDFPVPYEAVTCKYRTHIHLLDFPIPRIPLSELRVELHKGSLDRIAMWGG